MVTESRSHQFAVTDKDWKPFNSKVVKVVRGLHTRGFKIVVFRCASNPHPQGTALLRIVCLKVVGLCWGCAQQQEERGRCLRGQGL